jgi:hypothetical protein
MTEEPILIRHELEPLLVRHADAQKLLGLGQSRYYKLIREKKIVAVGRGRMGRCYFPSIKAYVEGLLAEAEARKAA